MVDTVKRRRHAMYLPEDVKKTIVDVITSTYNVDSIYIFGSYARGDADEESDIDIYVIDQENDKKSFDCAVGIHSRLTRALRYSKDIICHKRHIYDERKNTPGTLEYEVAKEGVKIYG
jgi:predicted nucleotidyltransferase